MLEQAAWIAGIIAAFAAVFALYKSVNRKNVQTNNQDTKITGDGNSVKQDASNTIDEKWLLSNGTTLFS